VAWTRPLLSWFCKRRRRRRRPPEEEEGLYLRRRRRRRMRRRRRRSSSIIAKNDLERHARTLSGDATEEEERSLIIDLKRHARLAVAWSRHGSLVPRWTV